MQPPDIGRKFANRFVIMAQIIDKDSHGRIILREGVSEPATLAAIIGFLESHEPDLIAAADHLGVRPEVLVRARAELEA